MSPLRAPSAISFARRSARVGSRTCDAHVHMADTSIPSARLPPGAPAPACEWATPLPRLHLLPLLRRTRATRSLRGRGRRQRGRQTPDDNRYLLRREVGDGDDSVVVGAG